MSRLRTIKHVRQKHAYGCVIASLAMISGLSYDEVAAAYPWIDDNHGADLDTVGHDFLWRHGFACQILYPYRPGPPITDDGEESRAQRARTPWPPAPWAEAHLCLVVIKGGSGGGHAVVMLADGTVLDPIVEELRRLEDYERVYNVRAVFDVKI